MKQALIAIALICLPTLANAADPAKPAKTFACTNYNVATTTDGATIGICGATKPGGKVTFLRSFQIVKLIDPTTDTETTLMVGFQ
jgi:hypothetical protein